MSVIADFDLKHAHRGGLRTESMAAAKASKGASGMKWEIQASIKEAGGNGLTPDHFSEVSGHLINTVRRRFTDLWKEGKIKHHPGKVMRLNSSGNYVVAWVLGEDGERKASRLELLQQENIRLRTALEAAGLTYPETS